MPPPDRSELTRVVSEMDVYAGRILSHLQQTIREAREPLADAVAAFSESGRELKRLSLAHRDDAQIERALRAWEAHRQEIHRAGFHLESFERHA